MAKKITWGFLITWISVCLLLALTPTLAGTVSARFNPVVEPGPYAPAAPEVAALHDSLTLVDLHADPLLWGRNLLKRSNNGQVDLPRLVEGNMALQVFGAVTQSPKGQNFQSNSADTDRLKPLIMMQHWPTATWDSFMQRAIYQAQRLGRLVNDAEGQMQWVRNRDELQQLMQRRAAGETVVGALMALEGAHALEGNVDNIDDLFQAGYRMIGMAHFIDNAMTGSAHGTERGGLTEAGRELVRRAEALGVAVDIAHASPAAVKDIFDIVTKPVVVSHTGVRGTCDSPRNLTDEMLDRLKANGGVAGIAMFDEAVCGNALADTVAAMRYVADRIGVEHVAIGADMDGGVKTPIDVSGMHKLTAEMQQAGFSDAEIRAISGDNAMRVLQATLPQSNEAVTPAAPSDQ